MAAASWVDARDELDASLVVRLHLLKTTGRIPAAVGELVNLPVAFVADEDEVLDAIELLFGQPIMAARPVGAERVDVGLLGRVDSFLRHRGPREDLVTPREFASSGGTPPEHRFVGPLSCTARQLPYLRVWTEQGFVWGTALPYKVLANEIGP